MLQDDCAKRIGMLSLRKMNFPAIRLALSGMILASVLFSIGCKRAASPEPSPQPTPASTPTAVLSKPSAIAEPPLDVPSPTPAASGRVLYVVTAFQAANDAGTHDFPVGAMVNVLSEEGDDYIVEYLGVSVRNGRAFFSETVVVAAPSPIPILPATTPDPALPGETLLSAAQASSTQDAATPMSEEDRKTSGLISGIRTLNDEIRTAHDKQLVASTTDQKEAEAALIKKLKSRRDKLSTELTKTAKP